MRLDVTQHLRLEQQMKLSPRIIQAMEILQLPMLALQERIEAEMEANPVLEVQPPTADDPDTPPPRERPDDRGEQQMVVKDDNRQREDFERLDNFTQEYGTEFIDSEAPSRPRPAVGERDRKMDAMANTAAPDQSLTEYLQDQWRFVETDKRIGIAGGLIINYIDESGYLRTPLEELVASTDAVRASLTPAELAEALRAVQMLDPLGVGARDLRECLQIQLAAESAAGRDVSLEMTIVERFLQDVEMNRLPRIAQRTDRSVEDIKKALENLSHLNPTPGSLIAPRRAPVIFPEILLEIGEDGEVIVKMADGNTPQLRISQSYRTLARDRKTDKEARQFLQKNIRSAQWLVGAIQQRRQTIYRVAVEVFRVQRDFLDAGEEALRPLPMADVAGRVGVHVATVSRAVSGKYVQTPRGIFPLRMFFSGGTTRADGKDVAWDAVKAKLKEIVDAEDKSAPSNDDQLAAELQKHGLKIARRTVAKYRRLLNIPPARKRREY